MRILARAAVITTAICLAVQVFAPAARAETAYRYWTFWTVSNGQWVFSQVGPASTTLVDGSIQAWRFAVTVGASGSTAAPRTDPKTAFAKVCGAVIAPPGQVRVAMIIDTGTLDAAPRGQTPPPARGACAVVDQVGTGADALMAIATPRVQGGLVCGIDEYPTGECAITIEAGEIAPATESSIDVLAAPTPAAFLPTLANATDPAPAPASENGSPVPLIAVGFVIALGLAGAWALQRRRVR